MSLFSKKDNLDVTTTDNRLTKVTIEIPGRDPQTIEVHGAAIVTIKDCGEKYEGSVGVFGNMCLKEVMELHDNALNRLVPELEKTALVYAADGHSLKDLVNALAKALEDE